MNGISEPQKPAALPDGTRLLVDSAGQAVPKFQLPAYRHLTLLIRDFTVDPSPERHARMLEALAGYQRQVEQRPAPDRYRYDHTTQQATKATSNEPFSGVHEGSRQGDRNGHPGTPTAGGGLSPGLQPATSEGERRAAI
jgi:hypothetical protein